MPVKIFTKEALKKYNGKHGMPAYTAYNGFVYDVSQSYHWRDGKHWVLHEAGTELTAEMAEAPHFDDVLKKFEIVGRYVKE